jgi:hypothetical protein
MANTTKAYGLRPLGKVGGGYTSGGQDGFYILDNASSSLYQGDLVALGSSGTVVPVTSSATGSVLGVFNGCLIEVNPNNRNKPTWQNYYTQTDISQGNIQAYVIDDPNQLYLVKSTNTGTYGVGVSAVGIAFDIVYAAGSTVTGISGDYLDLNATTSGQLLVLNVSQFIGNEVGLTNEDFVVKIKSGQSIL